MFSHYDRKGKCEWFEGGLGEFVSHYNREIGRSYIRTECLDVVRIGGSTAKQPEVLVTDPADGKRMVIERKSVVWPPDYILKHINGHNFADAIWAETAGRFNDACYELNVSGRQIETIEARRVREIAKEIGSRIAGLDSSQLPFRGTHPFDWAFYRADEHEHDGRKGVVVVQSDEMRLYSFLDEDAKVGTASAMQKELDAASLKFDGYSDTTRVVLLDFFGTELWEEDIPPLMGSLSVPENIDEIWMSKREWVSEDSFDIGYDRLFCRDLNIGKESHEEP